MQQRKQIPCTLDWSTLLGPANATACGLSEVLHACFIALRRLTCNLMMTADKRNSDAKAAKAHKMAEASPAEGKNLLLGEQVRISLYSIGIFSAHTFVSSVAVQGCHMRVEPI